MNDIEIRYDELEEAIVSVRLQLEQSTDKYVKNILKDCLDRLEEEFDEIKDTVENMLDSEREEQERSYEESVL